MKALANKHEYSLILQGIRYFPGISVDAQLYPLYVVFNTAWMGKSAFDLWASALDSSL
jgi:hypothetical protein